MSQSRDNGATVRLPTDLALPGLAALLDPRWFARAASAHLLPAGVEPNACTPLYVRYKPGTNAIIVCGLDLPGLATPLLVQGKCYTDGDFERARDKARNTGWSEPVLGAPLGACAAERVLLLSFPNDPVLEGLRHAAHPKRMQRTVYRHLEKLPQELWRISDSRLTLTPVRFKPEKRAVLRLDTRAVERATDRKIPLRLYLRIDADGRGTHDIAVLDHIHRGLADHPTVGSPRAVAYDQEHRLLIVEDAGDGSCVGPDNARAMGAALAALHALPAPALPVRTFAAHLDGARETAETVRALDATLGDDAAHLLALLLDRAGQAGGPAGITHGDCHPGQILRSGDRIIILDFDRSHLGDQAADLGNYLAHVDLAVTRGSATGGASTAGLLDAYAAAGGHRPVASRIALWHALGLLQLAATPFRALDPAWPTQTAALLARGREVLA